MVNNFQYTKELAKYCLEKNIRFVYASSSAVYGDDERLPKIETKIGNPLSPYAVTKYVNELYAKIDKWLSVKHS